MIQMLENPTESHELSQICKGKLHMNLEKVIFLLYREQMSVSNSKLAAVLTYGCCLVGSPESTKQMEKKLNFQVPTEGLELIILLHTQY